MFNDIQVRRPTLAQEYLTCMKSRPGLALVLASPWNTGKTCFLRGDLMALAVSEGIGAAYVDLWLHRPAPLEAMIQSLEWTVDGGQAGVAPAGNVPTPKLSLLGAGLGLGAMPRPRALPTSPLLRLEALASRLTRQRKGRCMLILDEAHTLADVPEGESIAAALRAILNKHGSDCLIVMATSAPDGPARIATAACADIQEFAQVVDFPGLGDDYLQALAAHFAQVHPGKALDLSQLRAAMHRFGNRAALIRDIVRTMSSEGMVDIEQGIDCYLSGDHRATAWAAVMGLLDAFDQAVLFAVAHGRPPLSQATIKTLAEIPGIKPTTARIRSAVEKLKRGGLISKTAQGIAIDDPLFLEYLRRCGASDIGQ